MRLFLTIDHKSMVIVSNSRPGYGLKPTQPLPEILMAKAAPFMGEFSNHLATPNPALRKVASFGPCPAQQSASLPSIAMAGTDLTPRLRARVAPMISCISTIVTSQDGQAS